MVFLSYFFIIFISVFDFQTLWSCPYTGYCSLPCPFMCPAPSPWQGGRPNIYPRGAFADADEEANPAIRSRITLSEESPPAAPPKPKAKPKQSKPDDDEELPKKKASSPPPANPPTRRFFTSLFSIPGAVVDTVLSGEIVL